ncbi:MAG: 2-oxo acid dehydrogenase subunit E2 [Erysipelotrichaceae bacterium]|nr:2-oxo acid dehydrogenase subunit E2 [Erysipelotrichaceae bacterium]MBR5048340.1 2-oxo acid dehydrogenase subunit E2 [Erysipelotrichaceae bacterium]
MTEQKKKRGDRHDGTLAASGDPIHAIMPYIFGERADNEAVLFDNFDVSEVDRYLERKNGEKPQYKYTYFHVILAALAKVCYMKPKMNRFIIGNRYYQRKDISFCFIAKNKMTENSAESVLIITADDNDVPICQQIHDKICAEVYKIKTEEAVDDTSQQLQWISKIPRPILKAFIRLLFWLNANDKLPKALATVDPYSSSCFVSNLGSIRMSAVYHHLINWGTNSIFALINQAKKIPFFNDDGSYEMRNAISMGFTIDERIGDGFYFARALELLKDILLHPDILDQPLSAPYEQHDLN